LIAEVALKPNGSIAPHSNPNLTYFLVIEGGGFVRVGDEQARVAAGQAVVWPPDVVHSAWTERTPMRAIVVEFAGDATEREPFLVADPTAEPARTPTAGPEPTLERPAGPSLEPGAGSGLAAGGATPLPPMPVRRESRDEEPW
jgi:hypothetical protein